MTTTDVMAVSVRTQIARRADTTDRDQRDQAEELATYRRMHRRRVQLGMPLERARYGTPPSVFTRRPDLLDLPTVSAGVQWLVRWSA